MGINSLSVGIGRRFFAVSGLTVVSRIFGVVREAIFSHFMGASAEMDAFLIAFKFPSFFRKFFAEGGFQSMFVPYYTDYYNSGKIKASKYFSSRIFTIIFFVTIFLTLIVFIFADKFVLLMAPGFCSDREKFLLATNFTRIIFPSVVFISLSSVYGGILIARDRFFAFAVTPILINIVLISSLLFGKNILPPGHRVSCGVLLAGIFQFCYLFWYLKKSGIATPSFSRVKFTHKIKQFLKKILPILAGAGVAQINVFIDSLLGSILPTGTISYIYFADRFIQLPLAIFGVSMGVILLPAISKKAVQDEPDQIVKVQNDALSFAIRMTLPAVVCLVSFAYFLISILYGHGRFPEASVQKTANILMVFAIGLPAYVAAKITSFILFAQKDSKTPIVAAFISIAVNIILSLILMIPLQGLGIALATAVSGFVNFYVMHRRLCRSTITISTFKNSLIASVIMFFFIEILKLALMDSTSKPFSQVIAILIICLIGMIVYVISLLTLKDDITVLCIQKLRTKFKLGK